jgi:hypothetical protein
MIRVTRWSPDTCGCVVEYEWDDEANPETRTHAFKAGTRCSLHAAAPGDHLAVVQEENTRKNLAILIAQSVRTGLRAEDVVWSFDGTRRFVMTVPGATNQQKNQMRSAADLQFGPGKVVIP